MKKQKRLGDLLVEQQKIICIGQLSSNFAKPDGFTKYSTYAIPKQIDVYKKCFGEELVNAHNAKYDVLAMIKIMFWIFNNNLNCDIINTEENHGKNSLQMNMMN